MPVDVLCMSCVSDTVQAADKDDPNSYQNAMARGDLDG